MPKSYPLHYYNDDGWLKIPIPLWLVFFLGVQHLWFLAPPLHKFMPEIAELQLDIRLFTGDVLTLIVAAAAGHRLSKGGLGVMRTLWRYGWVLMVIAYCATILGFAFRYWDVITWNHHRLNSASLVILCINLVGLLYLLTSKHCRDVFLFSPLQPSALSATGEADSDTPDVNTDPTPPGVALRKRSAEKLLMTYPVSDDAIPAERQACAKLLEDLENAYLWHELGVFYLQNNQLDKATDFVAHASRIDGANALYLRNLGELYRRSGRHKEAIEAGQAAARLNSSDPESFYNLGVIYTTMQNFKLAEQNYLQALRLNPNHLLAAKNLGLIRGAQKTQSKK